MWRLVRWILTAAGWLVALVVFTAAVAVVSYGIVALVATVSAYR